MNVFCKIILPLLCIISCSKRKEADNTMVLEKIMHFPYGIMIV